MYLFKFMETMNCHAVWLYTSLLAYKLSPFSHVHTYLGKYSFSMYIAILNQKCKIKIFRNSSLHLHFLVYSQAVYHRIIYFCKHFYTVRVIPPPVAVFDIVFVFSFRWTKKKRKWNLLLFSKLIKKITKHYFQGHENKNRKFVSRNTDTLSCFITAI